jgi:hypothetical protein
VLPAEVASITLSFMGVPAFRGLCLLSRCCRCFDDRGPQGRALCLGFIELVVIGDESDESDESAGSGDGSWPAVSLLSSLGFP